MKRGEWTPAIESTRLSGIGLEIHLVEPSWLVDAEVGLEDLVDPELDLLEVGQGGVVDLDVLAANEAVDLLADLFQMQPGQVLGVGRGRGLAAEKMTIPRSRPTKSRSSGPGPWC